MDPQDELQRLRRRVAELEKVAAERVRADESLRESERHLLQQNRVLAELARKKTLGLGDLKAALAELTEAATRTLEVERASVWLFDEARTKITCVDLYEGSARTHSDGVALEARHYPSYFAALSTERTINAHDAHTDPRTCEFSASYLTPLGITSMLDAPIWVGGHMVGVACHEHVGPRRHWSIEEENFAGSIADMASLAVEAHERRRAEEALRQAHDELERRVAERTAELADANDEIMRFAYVASHDLRAPLTNIQGFAGELRKSYELLHSAMATVLGQLDEGLRERVLNALEKDVPESLAYIDASTARMNALIDGVLKLARVGHRVLRFDTLSVDALVRQILKTMAHQVDEKRVSVAVGILPEVVADRASLEQVLSNLLSNAVAFLDPDRPGAIEITGERSLDGDGPDGDGETIFRIRDNGRGIAPSDVERVFDPFHRAGSQNVPGEGIGLSFVRTLVRRHGGRVWCESSLGSGTTFIFTLPHRPADDLID
jgi:signal transduction histidine kinase